MANLDNRMRVHRERRARRQLRLGLLKALIRRSLACFVILAMIVSGTKMPVAYAYFTAVAEQEAPFAFEINGACQVQADVHFLDEHLVDEGAARTKGVRARAAESPKAFQPVITKPTVTAVVTLEEGFNADDVDISTVEIQYEDRSAFALSGVVRGGDLVLEFDRAELVSWFDNLGERPNPVAFDVTGAGLLDGLYEFVFTGPAEIKLVGAYETTAVNIDGPEAHLIPEGDKTATGTYHLVNQKGVILEAVWTVHDPADGVTVDTKTGRVTVDTGATPGIFTLRAEFTRPDGTHYVEKTVQLAADPRLTITGPRSITVGDQPQQYTIQTRDNPVLRHINWLISGPADGVTVDGEGLVTVSDNARAGEFTLQVQAELIGLPVSAETTVALEEPPAAAVPEAVPEEEVFVPEASLPENAIVIRGEDLILIPSSAAATEAQYAAADRNGNPLADVVWSVNGLPDGVSFDKEQGTLAVSGEAREGTLTLEAALEVRDDTGESESVTAFYGKKTITIAQPASVTVRINGPESIVLPEGDPEQPLPEDSFHYAAVVLDQKGNVLDGEDIVWSLDGEITGVTIDQAGVLTITGAVEAETVTITVTCGKIVGTLTVALTANPEEDIEDPAEDDADTEDPVAGGGANDPPNREEESEGPDTIDNGDNPDGDDDPGVEPKEPGQPGEDPGDDPGNDPINDPDDDDPGDDPGEDPVNDPDEDSAVDPGDDPGEDPANDPGDDPGEDTGDDPGDQTEPSGNEMTDPKDNAGGGSVGDESTGGTGDHNDNDGAA